MAKVIDDTREGELSQQVEALVIKLSASEKRAEEAEALKREWWQKLCEAERDRASLRISLARVVEDAAAMAEARADSFIKTGAQIGWAERENWAENMRNLAKDIRSALHRSQGE